MTSRSSSTGTRLLLAAASVAARSGISVRLATVCFRWVLSHTRDPFDEAADRLAVLARRRREADLSCDEVQRLTASAHGDVLNDIQRSSMELAA